jgi:hypothetical protein
VRRRGGASLAEFKFGTFDQARVLRLGLDHTDDEACFRPRDGRLTDLLFHDTSAQLSESQAADSLGALASSLSADSEGRPPLIFVAELEWAL